MEAEYKDQQKILTLYLIYLYFYCKFVNLSAFHVQLKTELYYL